MPLLTDSEILRMMRDANQVRAAIVEKTQGRRGANGEIRCPVCKTGPVYFTVSPANGHIHAACTTQGCVDFCE